MKYGLIPENPHEEALLNEAPHARTLLEPFLGLATAHALMAFVRSGLAAALAAGTRSVDEVTTELGLDVAGTGRLLRLMQAAGYVEAAPNDVFALAPLGRATLLPGAPARLDAWVLHNALHGRVFAGMDETLRAGSDRDLHHRLDSPAEWAIYQRAMLQTARPAAAAVAAHIPEPDGRGLLLDLGGSHGLYGAAICRRFAPMRSRVIDLPEAIEAVRALGAEEGLGEAVEYVAGDLADANLGREICDIVFLGNVIHHVDEARLPDLLARARNALRPGGVIAVWDMMPAPDESPPDVVVEAFSLLFHLSSAAACRGPQHQAELLAAAGFGGIEVHGGISPTHGLVTARR